MLNPTQFDISSVDVRMRAEMLDCLSEITKYSTGENFLTGQCRSLMNSLLTSIKNDIGSLEERPVVDLVKVLTKLLA